MARSTAFCVTEPAKGVQSGSPGLSSICGSIEAEPSHPGCHDGCVIEWHGWATIFTAPDAVDDTLLPATVDSVKRLVADRAGRSNEVVELNRANYLMHLWLPAATTTAPTSSTSTNGWPVLLRDHTGTTRGQSEIATSGRCTCCVAVR